MSKWISRRPSLFFFFQRINESVWKSYQQQCYARTRHNERTNWNYCSQNLLPTLQEMQEKSKSWWSHGIHELPKPVSSMGCLYRGLTEFHPTLSCPPVTPPLPSPKYCPTCAREETSDDKHHPSTLVSTKSLLPSWETTVYSVFDCWGKVMRNTAVEFNVMVLCTYICTCCLHILTKIHHIFAFFVFVWAQVVMCYNMYVEIREQLWVWIFSYQFETGSVCCLSLHEMGYLVHMLLGTAPSPPLISL